MQLVDFKQSKDFTVGVELELQIIDPDSRDLVSGASKIIKNLKSYPNIKNELFESVIEINSNICNTISELESDLKKHVSVLHKAASELGFKLSMGGTHPTANWSRQEITQNKRYLQFVESIGMPVRRNLVFGTHFHIGLRNGDEAIIVNNSLAGYLPHFLALSCSSPYWVKRDSGMESYRVKIFETLPTTGLPFPFRSWEEYCSMISALQNAGTIKSIREIWWDTRPHPDLGTVEVRICDATSKMEDIIAVAALIQSFVTYITLKYRANEMIVNLPSFLLRENKWRAARYGLNSKVITDKDGNTGTIKYEIEKLVTDLSSTAKDLKCEQELYKVMNIVESGTSSMRQRNLYKETNGDWNVIVDSMINEFEETWGLKQSVH